VSRLNIARTMSKNKNKNDEVYNHPCHFVIHRGVPLLPTGTINISAASEKEVLLPPFPLANYKIQNWDTADGKVTFDVFPDIHALNSSCCEKCRTLVMEMGGDVEE
jgi:hypothetical protein